MPRNCNIFVETTIRLANIFSAIPYYDFKKQKVTHKNLFKLYGLIVTSTMPLAMIYSHGMYKKMIISTSPLLSTINLSTVAVSLLLFVVTVLGSSFWNMGTWERMLKLLFEKNYELNCNGKYFFSFPFVYFIIGNIYVIILFISTVRAMGLKYVGYILHIMVLDYSRFLETCLMYIVIVLIRNKYKMISDSLTDINLCVIIEDSTTKKLRETKQFYEEADKLVEHFNGIFGWPLLFFLAESVQIMLLSLALLTEQGLRLPMDMAISSDIVVLNSFYTLMTVVSNYLETI